MHKDLQNKIGLITGAGSVQLLDAVKNQLAAKEITNTNEMYRVIRETIHDYAELYPSTAQQELELTGWVFTYNIVVETKSKLRLYTYRPKEDKIALMMDNKPVIINPAEANEKQARLTFDYLEQRIKPSKDFSSLSESIKYHASIILQLIQSLQPIFPSISSRLQIGVHTCDNLTGISEIIDDYKTFNLILKRDS